MKRIEVVDADALLGVAIDLLEARTEWMRAQSDVVRLESVRARIRAHRAEAKLDDAFSALAEVLKGSKAVRSESS